MSGLKEFRPDPSVPIVGQRFRITGATILPILECACGKGVPLALVAQLVGSAHWQGMQGRCQGCGTGYHVQTVSTDKQGNLQIGIAIALPSESAPES